MIFKVKLFFIFSICISGAAASGCVNNVVQPQNSASAPQPAATVSPGGESTKPRPAKSPSDSADAGGAPATDDSPTAAGKATSGTIDGQAATIEVTELKRIAGDMVMLRVTVTNDGAGDINGGFFYQALTRTYLLDAEKQKKYQILRDGDGNALATGINFDRFAPGTRREVFAQFPAPLSETRRMSVYFGGSMPILDVNLTQ